MSSAGVSGSGKPSRRADANQNRARILAAARAAFIASGTGVPLDEIARSAGVGNATLYRHFPNRDALLHNAVVSVFDRIAELGRAEPERGQDAFEALLAFALGAVEEGIGALCLLLPSRLWAEDPELRAARRRVDEAVAELVERGQKAGLVRPDVGAGDLMVALSLIARPLPDGGAGRLVDRIVRLLMDGFAAPAKTPLPGRATAPDDLPRHS
ncbi:TetR/AcrR family transcriptional regulator [Spirillospora sp. NPDC050679]